MVFINYYFINGVLKRIAEHGGDGNLDLLSGNLDLLSGIKEMNTFKSMDV